VSARTCVSYVHIYTWWDTWHTKTDPARLGLHFHDKPFLILKMASLMPVRNREADACGLDLKNGVVAHVRPISDDERRNDKSKFLLSPNLLTYSSADRAIIRATRHIRFLPGQHIPCRARRLALGDSSCRFQTERCDSCHPCGAEQRFFDLERCPVLGALVWRHGRFARISFALFPVNLFLRIDEH